MTDENQFGRYTLDEMNDAIREALRREREHTAKVVLVGIGVSYLIGIAVGYLSL